MTRAARLALFFVSATFLVALAAVVAWHMPRFGAHPLPYGDAVNARGTAERHVTNMVSAVNFDYRGIDTLGEEFMLLAAVTGAVLLLRGGRGEDRSAKPGTVLGRPIRPRTDALAATGRVFAPPIFLFGLYVALHANTTPGGGFQGGVIAASAFPLLFLGDGYKAWRRLTPTAVLETLEGGGAGLYAVAALAPLLSGAPVLANILPLGKPKDLFSGGLMLVLNAGVTFAVAGGFLMLFREFLEETRVERAPE